MILRVGIDLDGCLFNFGDSVRRYLESTDRGHLWKSGPTAEPFWNWYEDWGWTVDEFKQMCHEGADAGVIFSGPARDNAVDALWQIKSMGHKIVVITDRSFGRTPLVSQELTRRWWDENGFPAYDELYFSADKTIADTDIFVEDRIENYRDLEAAGTECWLITRAWNKNEDVPNRISDIKEFPFKVIQKAFQSTRNLTHSN